MILVVNYHYIGDEKEYQRGIYPISSERLRNQLQLLGRTFKFVSQKDILDNLERGKRLPGMACLITFDDGLKNQYEKALPILDELNIPAIFFVNGIPYDKHEPLLISKIHWCRAHIDPKIFLEKVKENYLDFTGEEFNTDILEIKDEELKKHYYYDSPDEARLKFALDKGSINQEVKEKVIGNIFSELVSDKKDFCDFFYMSASQIKDIYQRNYLGIHTYSHKPLGFVSREVCKEEIFKCLDVLSNILGVQKPEISSLSYPYGNSEVVPDDIYSLAKQAGFKLGFTTERSFNQNLDNPFNLARIDTNDAPGGKAPYFEIENNKIKITNNKMHMFRKDNFKK